MNRALPFRQVAKPWGRADLPAPFASGDGQNVGEIWFDPPPELPGLLVKYLFTSEKLSVQVHPTDAQSMAAGLGQRGKEECWFVLDARPGAVLGIGFRNDITAQVMRQAALDGSIEQLMEWHPAQAGDFFYIPAGTVHAIGPGLSLIEVQQNSDITYRLFDYGRPRELHLDAGLAVAAGGPHDPALRRKLPDRGSFALVRGPFFRMDRVDGPPSADVAACYDGGPLLAIPLAGGVDLGGASVQAGQCAVAASLASLTFSSNGQCLLAQPCQNGGYKAP